MHAVLFVFCVIIELLYLIVIEVYCYAIRDFIYSNKKQAFVLYISVMVM